MSKIGVFGGAFDPLHIGHLIIAERARKDFKLQKIIFIPTNIPPHKPPPLASALDRLELVKTAVQDKPYFKVSDMEIKRGGVSYWVDTLRELKKGYPKDEIFTLIGMDEALDFMNWKEPNEILKLSRFIIITRPSSMGVYPPPLNKNANFISLNLDISSTEIRARIKRGKSIKHLVPERVEAYIVEAYIKEKKLYKYGEV
ncbi:nicotinate-nucleotide adenylyltransferase [candidate division WOR-3 bacterium]|nr:nicotinate-nucleotide adenylyltransferase [candidate division WOR-3 bacterium]